MTILKQVLSTIEGAAPGDTVVVHIRKLEPGRTTESRRSGPASAPSWARIERRCFTRIFRRLRGVTISQTARAPIIQLVDPAYTVLVKLAKARLPR